MLQSVEILMFLIWGVFFAFWWLPVIRGRKRNSNPVRRGYSRSGFMTIAAVPAFVVFTVIAVIAPWMYEAVVLPETLPVILSGFVLLLCGLGFSVRARLELGGNWTARPAIREKQTLVRTGPYAYVRHPIYTGLLTAFLGSAILTGALVAFICLVVIALVLFIKIRMEENFLIEEFGEEYEQYRSETKALIPRLI